MEYLGVLGFVFGIFGFFAYLQMSALKKRVMDLERALSKIEGTTYAENARSFAKAMNEYVGKSVIIDFREDYMDSDIISYGNTKHGSNVILDVDEEWMLVRVETPKKTMEKLIRTDSVSGVRPKEEN